MGRARASSNSGETSTLGRAINPPKGIVTDPISGRRVVFAPHRDRRPGAPGASTETAPDAEQDERCPFCEGHENETPPEMLALGTPPERAADSPGWKVRVVPNLYPAFERQQVVIHSPDHLRSLAELSPAQLALVAQAWTEIADRAWKEGFDHVQALVNEGRAAGASRAHGHSQMVWLREPPPEIRAEQPRLEKGSCALCALLANGREELAIAETASAGGRLCLLAAPVGRAPYELLIAPLTHEADGFGSSEQLALALGLAADAVRRLREVAGAFPFNLWLHGFSGDGHWHLELVPRLNVFGGLELGAGIFVNTIAPEEAAARLRALAL